MFDLSFTRSTNIMGAHYLSICTQPATKTEIISYQMAPMALSRLTLQVILFVVLIIHSEMGLAQGLSIDRFCDIYADTAPQRIDKIIRLFKLPYRSADQLNGKSFCQNGESFEIKTSCIGPNRVAILSLSHPKSQTKPSSATRLFHLYTTTGDKSFTPCQPVAE